MRYSMKAKCLPGEEWKPSKTFKHIMVSNMGRIYSLRLNRILKGYKNSKGYVIIKGKLDKPEKAHRLVAEAFLGNIKGKQIDHINGVKHDNRLKNIRLVSCLENMQSFRTVKKDASSKFRGVDRRYNKWRARISGIDLGNFPTEIEAALAYNKKALELGFNKEALNKI